MNFSVHFVGHEKDTQVDAVLRCRIVWPAATEPYIHSSDVRATSTESIHD